jgi:hypothetical protein
MQQRERGRRPALNQRIPRLEPWCAHQIAPHIAGSEQYGSRSIAVLMRKSWKVSDRVREYSCFAETMAETGSIKTAARPYREFESTLFRHVSF